MKGVSERLSQEFEILRQIRLTISTYRTVEPGRPHRKGTMYASYAITSGRRLYKAMQNMGYSNADVFRRDDPEAFRRLVVEPNLRDGRLFGQWLREKKWPLTIVPGCLYAPDWNQEHYMSLWRQVISAHVKNIALDALEFPFTTGSAEEFLIGMLHHKRLFLRQNDFLRPVEPETCLALLRQAIDQIDAWGFDAKPLFAIWSQASLTLEGRRALPTSD